MSADTEEHARALYAAWTGGPAVAAPAPADPYAVQEAVLRLSGWRVGGWKVGATSPDAEPQAAPIPAHLLLPATARLDGSAMRMIGVEAELAFRFGRDVTPGGGRTAVEEAIAAVMPVVEVLDTRLADWAGAAPALRLADNQSNGALLLGPERRDWRAVDPGTQPVQLFVGGSPARAAVGGNPAGDPVALLAWLADALARRGRQLRANDVVTTGSCTGITWLRPCQTARATWPGLGMVELTV